MIESLLERATTEVVEHSRRKSGISPSMEATVLQSSQRMVRDAYQTILQIQRDMPKGPTATKLPEIPSSLDAKSRAELEKRAQRIAADTDKEIALRYASLVERHRRTSANLFIQLGVSSATTKEIVDGIYPPGN